MLKLKFQYFGQLMWRTDSFEKTLMLGKIEGRRRRGWQGWDCWMASPTQWTWVWANSGSWCKTGRPGMLRFVGLQRVGHDWSDLAAVAAAALWKVAHDQIHVLVFCALMWRWSLSKHLVQCSAVQLLSRVRLFATPYTSACQVSLSITNSRSLLRLVSIELVMPFNHVILSSPSPSALNLSQHEGLFKWVSSSHQVAKVLEFQFSKSPSNEYSGLTSSRMDWLDLLAVQGTLKTLLQHHTSKASILWCSAFFTVQLLHPYMTTGKTIALTRWTFIDKVMSLLLNML